MSSPSAVAATITKLEGSKQVEYDRAQATAQAEAKREYSVADSGGGRGCPGGSDVGPHYAGGLVFTHLRGRGILRSWYAGCRIAPLAGHPKVGLRLLGSST